MRELDERLGFSELIAEHLTDSRGKNTQLPLPDLLRQSIYSRLAGYEDVNDAERLSQDPTFRLIGSEKIWANGSCDAVGKYTNGKDQTNFALSPWTGRRHAANPCIRLDYSGLVAIDVDDGFEGLTDEQMIVKGEEHGLPRTYTVRTGRVNGGATFFYIGTRTLPDCTPSEGSMVSRSVNYLVTSSTTVTSQRQGLCNSTEVINGLTIPSSRHAHGSKYIRSSAVPALFTAPFGE